jgi:hypothetical protein
MFAEYAAQAKSGYYKTDLLITEILHNTIEDTILTKAMIKIIFGMQIANLS